MKAWGAPLRQSPAEGEYTRALRYPSPLPLSRGPMSAPLPGTAPGAWSRLRAFRAVLALSSVTIEDAHLRRICQAFYQARGQARDLWLPRHGRQPSHPSPGPSTAGGHTPDVWPYVVARNELASMLIVMQDKTGRLAIQSTWTTEGQQIRFEG